MQYHVLAIDLLGENHTVLVLTGDARPVATIALGSQ
jgi:hypothetical protein